MFRRPQYIALALVTVVTLILLNLPERMTARVKLGIGGLFLPLFGLAGSAHQVTNKAADSVVSRSELIRENEVLRRQNQEMTIQAEQAAEVLRENARLRQFYGWPQQQRWKLRLANVVLRDPANWWRSLQIDLGQRDGLTNNLPVLSPDGALVGRIASVSLKSSQVVLLGDPNLKVSARVENDTHDTGVIGPSGPVEAEFVQMGYLSRNASLKPGQRVVTSGNGGIFPRGIPIGQIVDSQSVDYGLRVEAQVKLAADLNALEEVWVLFP